MMLFVLSKKNIDLSRAEAINLLDLKKTELFDNLLITDTKRKDYTRLAYTKEAHEILFKCKKSELKDNIRRYRWDIKDYAVRKRGKGPAEKILADMIYASLEDPKVNLKNPKDIITFFFEDYVFACRLKWKRSEDFNSRKPHMRVDCSPVSLDPQLARCLVNLTGARSHILDPCCGTGGLLIEAGLMGIRSDGIDIDPVMIRRTQNAIQDYKIDYSLHIKDAFTWKRKTRFIVTDLPYGKNTRNIYEDFYKDFLRWLSKIMIKRAVIVFPHWIDFRRLSKLQVKECYQYYIHRSMSKKIVIYEK